MTVGNDEFAKKMDTIREHRRRNPSKRDLFSKDLTEEEEKAEFESLPVCHQPEYGTCKVAVQRGNDARCAMAKSMSVSCKYKGSPTDLKEDQRREVIEKKATELNYLPPPKIGKY